MCQKSRIFFLQHQWKYLPDSSEESMDRNLDNSCVMSKKKGDNSTSRILSTHIMEIFDYRSNVSVCTRMIVKRDL